MPGVIADTGPINDLLLIGEIERLPQLFGSILVPDGVAAKLRHQAAHDKVRDWIAAVPPWAAIVPTPPLPLTFEPALDPGERCVVALAEAIAADLLLLDDRQAVLVAIARGFRSRGTLGVLADAAARGLIDLPTAINRLQSTSFRVRPSLLADLLTRQRRT
jgi:hypothetical protein